MCSMVVWYCKLSWDRWHVWSMVWYIVWYSKLSWDRWYVCSMLVWYGNGSVSTTLSGLSTFRGEEGLTTALGSTLTSLLVGSFHPVLIVDYQRRYRTSRIIKDWKFKPPIWPWPPPTPLYCKNLQPRACIPEVPAAQFHNFANTSASQGGLCWLASTGMWLAIVYECVD